jgi:hypothetical protein
MAGSLNIYATISFSRILYEAQWAHELHCIQLTIPLVKETYNLSAISLLKHIYHPNQAISSASPVSSHSGSVPFQPVLSRQTCNSYFFLVPYGSAQPGPILTPQPLTAATCNLLNCRLYIFIRDTLLPQGPPANPTLCLPWEQLVTVHSLLVVT